MISIRTMHNKHPTFELWLKANLPTMLDEWGGTSIPWILQEYEQEIRYSRNLHPRTESQHAALDVLFPSDRSYHMTYVTIQLPTDHEVEVLLIEYGLKPFESHWYRPSAVPVSRTDLERHFIDLLLVMNNLPQDRHNTKLKSIGNFKHEEINPR